MIAITAANTRNLPMSVKSRPNTYDKKGRAQAAAVRELGAHAREGFEYETSKMDGRWIWRTTDGTREENQAQLKANGGKRSMLSAAHQLMAADGAPAICLRSRGEKRPVVQMVDAAVEKTVQEVVAKPALVIQDSTVARPAPAVVGTSGRGKVLHTFKNGHQAWMTKRELEVQLKLEAEAKKLPAKMAAASTSKASSGKPVAAVGRPDGLKPGSSAAILVDTLCRPGGATNQELCDAVGWKECLPMVRKSAARAGVTINTVKEKGQLTRYVGTRA